jgi:hypothetical protein
MSLFRDAKRWVKDRFSHDDGITVTPKVSIHHAEKYLGQMNATERERTLKHLQAYSTLYYQGRHNEKVPFEVRTKLQAMERRIERLNTVDQARKIVEQYGGPPTRQTVMDSLTRTAKQQVEEYKQKQAAAKQQQSIKQKQSVPAPAVKQRTNAPSVKMSI